MTAIDIPIIILAAGASRRMLGRDKLLEKIDGIPLLRHQALKALAVTTGPVLVALPVAPHPRYDALDGLTVTPVPVPLANEGMNASLREAFAAVPVDAKAAMLLLGDLPDLSASDLKKVAERVDFQSQTLVWRGVTEDGAPGHPIVFRSSLFEAFAHLHGDDGGREVIAQVKGRIQLIPLEGQRARGDLDTPGEWAEWHARRSLRNSP